MSKTRRYFFLILAPILVLIVVLKSWSVGVSSLSGTEAIPELSAAKIAGAQSLPEQLFELQSKLVVGATKWTQHNTDLLSEEMRQKLREDVKESFSEALRTLQSEENVNRTFLRKQYIVASYLGLPAKLPDLENAPQENLGWFELLAASQGAKDEQTRASLEQEIVQSTQAPLRKFAIGIFLGMAFAFASILLFFIFAFRLARGRMSFEFRKPNIQPEYCLEVFTLYLLAMLCGSGVVEFFSGYIPGANPVMLNVVLIGCMPLVILWPLLFGVKLTDLRESIGLQTGSARTFVRNTLDGPLLYVASWTILAAVLVLYSAALMGLGVDPSKGSHPIVPILLTATASQTLMLVILAVVVAPVVEEIMFRGALYSWLRSRFGPAMSMFTCAIVFAAVHPQGVIGLVPLTCIGLILAFAREWKHSLVTCMIAHACVNGGTLLLLLLFLR